MAEADQLSGFDGGACSPSSPPLTGQGVWCSATGGCFSEVITFSHAFLSTFMPCIITLEVKYTHLHDAPLGARTGWVTSVRWECGVCGLQVLSPGHLGLWRSQFAPNVSGRTRRPCAWQQSLSSAPPHPLSSGCWSCLHTHGTGHAACCEAPCHPAACLSASVSSPHHAVRIAVSWKP